MLTFQLKSLFKEREDGSRQENVTQAELQAALQQLAPAVLIGRWAEVRAGVVPQLGPNVAGESLPWHT